MKSAVSHLVKAITHAHPEIKITQDKTSSILLPKLQLQEKEALIKIEINSVFRGTVFPVSERLLCEMGQKLFESEFRLKTLSLGDLYAGKICAALSRQHPRDLFDVKLLLSSYDITEEIRQAFVVYLSGGNRPLHELLNPNLKPYAVQENIYTNEFLGMTDERKDYRELATIPHELAINLTENMRESEKAFLLSVCAGRPQWELMPFTHLKDLPALTMERN